MANTSARPTDEVEIAIAEVNDSLEVNITFVDAQKAPYSFFDTLGIRNYQILDQNGRMIVKGAETTAAAINNDQVQISLSLEAVPAGEYKLVVTELIGGAKAEQPLVVKGNWECGFKKAE